MSQAGSWMENHEAGLTAKLQDGTNFGNQVKMRRGILCGGVVSELAHRRATKPYIMLDNSLGERTNQWYTWSLMIHTDDALVIKGDAITIAVDESGCPPVK